MTLLRHRVVIPVAVYQLTLYRVRIRVRISVGVISSLSSRHADTLAIHLRREYRFLLASTRAISIFRISIRGDERLMPGEQNVCTCRVRHARARRMPAGALLKLRYYLRHHIPRDPYRFSQTETNARRSFAPYTALTRLSTCANIILIFRIGMVTFRPRAVLQYRFAIFES